MNTGLKKITARINTTTSPASQTPSRTNSPRPPSPTKFPDPKPSSVVSATFRPKAKINTGSVIRKSPSVISNATATPRSSSPTRLFGERNPNLSPTYQPKVAGSNVSARTATGRSLHTPISAPGAYGSRARDRSGRSEVGRPADARIRESESSQLQHTMSFSSLKNVDSTAPMRIRAKVSVGKQVNDPPRAPSPPPSAPQPTVQVNRLRSPSTSTVSSTTTSSQVRSQPSSPSLPPATTSTSPVYPLTTSSPAANPHRYGQMRPMPSVSHFPYTPQVVSASTIITPRPMPPRINGKTDYNLLPSAPASPPVSAVSFSSRSSISSVSRHSRNASGGVSPVVTRGRDTFLTQPVPMQRRSISASSAESDDSSHPHAENGEHKVKAEAKSNRKIADLEISNRSLLTINATLEASKSKQAKEIRELRRKLRETRLSLPPVEYRAAKSSWGPEEMARMEDEDTDEDSELEDATQGNGDEIYKRVRGMLEGMIKQGKDALEKKVEDFSSRTSTKVLTGEELNKWNGTHPASEDEDEDIGDDVSVSFTTTTHDGGDSDHDLDPDSFGNIVVVPGTPT